jgi:Site-specific recombinase XerC
MRTIIDVICYKARPLKNNEYPLMIRITKDRKRKYKSIGLSIKEEDWDFNKNQPKPNVHNRELIIKIIDDKLAEYRNAALEYKIEGRDFTASYLMERVSKPQAKVKTVAAVFSDYIDNLKAQNRLSYAASVYEALNSLQQYDSRKLDIFFYEIDVTWLKNYEVWSKKRGLKNNTIALRLRTLRVIYNQAIEHGYVKAELYPFKKYKVSKLSETTAKRALNKNFLEAVISYNTEGKDNYTKLAVDLFTFSYLMGGINFVDMASLTDTNIVDEKLIYRRKKTAKMITLPLHDMAKDILKKHSSEEKYLFPVLTSFHKTEQQKTNRVHKAISKINIRLKRIGKELKLPIDLTTYVARHSFATILKKAGVSTSIISESLGHSSERVTQTYLDSFDNEQIYEAMKKLL